MVSCKSKYTSFFCGQVGPLPILLMVIPLWLTISQHVDSIRQIAFSTNHSLPKLFSSLIWKVSSQKECTTATSSLQLRTRIKSSNFESIKFCLRIADLSWFKPVYAQINYLCNSIWDSRVRGRGNGWVVQSREKNCWSAQMSARLDNMIMSK